MKALVFGILLFIVVIAIEGVSLRRPKLTLRKSVLGRHSPGLRAHGPLRVGKLDGCKDCIEFTDQALDQLLNIILNIGVVGTCGQLCGILENKTGSEALGAVCTILCDVAGIKEFVNIINKADLDPIYFCELVKVCKVFDGGDAKITSLTVSPTEGHQGATFSIQMAYTTQNGTGTGQALVEIFTVDGMPVGDAELIEPQQPGSYEVTWSLSTKSSCDPSQGPCEQWLPGDYGVKTFVCNGECGSKHPHSKIYDQAAANFTLTEK